MSSLPRQRPRVWRQVLFNSVVGVIAVLVVIAGLGYAIRTPNYRLLQEQGDSIIAAVEQHRAITGEYPENLDDVGIQLDETPYGQWHYSKGMMLKFANGTFIEGEYVDYFVVCISTKDQPHSLLRPWFTMSRWNRSSNWRINTSAC